MKSVFWGILGLVCFIAIVFLLELGGLKWTEFFAPKRENVRRKVFLETRSYNEGKMQDLVKYRLEYLRAKTEDERMAIASTIRMSFAEYDETKLTPELRNFLETIKY
jgi:hypothetical protein